MGGLESAAASRDAVTVCPASVESEARRLVVRWLLDVPAFERVPGRPRRSDRRGQAPKGAGGMPRRHQNSGVEGCDKSGGAAQRALSPEYLSNPGN